MHELISSRYYKEMMIDWRHRIHEIPEIGFQEHLTSELVANALQEFGFDVHRGIGGTGVVGLIRRGASNASVGLRADMDALPIMEENSFSYRSKNQGLMHACGHDGHTAMLLGAAAFLSKGGDFDGSINVIFQPAEEALGGADAMIRDGLFERFPCDAIYAMHNKPGLKVGHFGVYKNSMMAGGSVFEIRLTGRSAHASRPDLAVDPLIAASQIVSSLQSIVSHDLDPRTPAVVSVTKFISGEAVNVLPHEAIIAGTLRYFTQTDLDRIEARMKTIVSGIAQAFRVTAAIEMSHIFKPLVNNENEANLVEEVCKTLVGDERVFGDLPLIMASEDFASMLRVVPGCYINIGNGASGEYGGCDVHNGHYDFNDDALPYGAAFFVEVAKRKLRELNSFGRVRKESDS